MHVRGPRADEPEWNDGNNILGGHADTADHPWEWDDDTIAVLAAELEAKLAKKKPLGFGAWPDADM